MFGTNLTAQTTVNINISPGNSKKLISPFIYGKNNSISAKPNESTNDATWTQIIDAGVTILRESSGNESTKYNWRKKLTGSPDWYNCVWTCDWDYEAKSLQDKYPQAQGMWSFQLLGKVAKSTSANWDVWDYHVKNNTPWPPCNAHQNVSGGGVPNMSNPKSDKAAVEGNSSLYLQDWPADSTVAILDHWFGSGGLGLNKSKIKYWCMDNEVEIWNGTHDDVQPSPTAEEHIQKYVTIAKLARQKYPDIKLIGPATANEWQWYAKWGGSNLGAVEFFIKRIAEEQKKEGIRLLDVLDIHFYPGDEKPEDQVQTHRVWFDKTFDWPMANGVKMVNGGWDENQKKEYIFVRCQEWLDKYFGTGHGIGLGVTEIGLSIVKDPNVSAVWYASTMGEFMKNGVEVFTPWSWKPGMWEVIHLFSRYNKAYSISGTSGNEKYLSVYPSINKTGDSLTVVLVNRSLTETYTANIDLGNYMLTSGNAEMLSLSQLPASETFISHNQNALKKTTINISNSKAAVSLPPMSVSSLVIGGGITGIGDIKSNSLFKVFPNPTSGGKFTVKLDEKIPCPQNIEVYNLQGQKLLSKTLFNADKVEIDISGYDKGMYLVKFQNASEMIIIK